MPSAVTCAMVAGMLRPFHGKTAADWLGLERCVKNLQSA